MTKPIFALLALIAASASFAQGQPKFDPAEWADARPASAVVVSSTDKEGIYYVQARITDLRNGTVLATPALTTKSGAPTTFEMGSATGVVIKFVVVVDAAGRSASYVSEIRRNGQLETSQTANIVVEKPAV